MEQSELIIRLVARAVVVIYLIRLAVDLAGWPRNPVTRSARELQLRYAWTAAWALHLLHVLLAFEWIHLWSHAAAFEHTARQTATVTGLNWGGGVWINYAFTVLWLGDVVYSWRVHLDRLPGWYRTLLHSVMLFMIVNATVVFGPAWWKWVSIPIFCLLTYIVVRNRDSTLVERQR